MVIVSSIAVKISRQRKTYTCGHEPETLPQIEEKVMLPFAERVWLFQLLRTVSPGELLGYSTPSLKSVKQVGVPPTNQFIVFASPRVIVTEEAANAVSKELIKVTQRVSMIKSFFILLVYTAYTRMKGGC